MLGSEILDIAFRNIPECMLFIFSGYAFAKYKLQFKRYFLSVGVLALVGYIIERLLPVGFGISQILVIIVSAALLTTINLIPMQKAIASVFAVMILGFVTDIIAVVCTALIKGLDIQSIITNSALVDSVFKNQVERLCYGAISLVIMAIVLLSLYFIAKKRGTLKNVPVGKSVEKAG
ncbi:MAG: hypothetical protein AB1Z19_05050 [Eubacteriales bacterium]